MDDLRVILGLINPLAGLVAWFIRLESKVKQNTKDLDEAKLDLRKYRAEFSTHLLDNDRHLDLRIEKNG